MPNGGQWFKLSRRDFAKAAAASIVTGATAGKVSAMSESDATTQATSQSSTSQPHTSGELIEARVKWLEDQLGRPIRPELRDKVAKQIAGNDAMWRRGRKFLVPDGTEPAFVFEPISRKPQVTGKQT